MIILHYIQSMALSSGIIPEYVNSLVRATELVATSHIVTEKDLGTAPYGFYKGFKHQLELLNPDIVHLHGAWNYHTAWAELIARSNGYFTVVSPHGELAPSKMEQKFWTQRFPRILIYQLRMIRRCNMLVVTTRQEEQDMKNLKWKKNMALIPHPVLNELSSDQIGELLLSAYRKVIDTNYRQRLTPEEEIYMNTCLKAAVWPKEKELPDDLIAPDKNDISFRRLYLYAHDEEVTELFISGAHRLEISLPPKLNVDEVPRFKVKLPVNKRQNRLYKTTMEILNKLLPQNRHRSIDIKRINLLALTNIYAQFRFNDFDEDEVNKLLKKYSVRRYTKRLLHTLQDIFQLEEGYMPFPL